MNFSKIIQEKSEYINVSINEMQKSQINEKLMLKYLADEHMCDITEYCVAVLRNLKKTNILKF